MLDTTSGSAIVGAAQAGPLLLEPVQAAALAFNPRCSTAVRITESTDRWRAPRITDDPSAAWVAEGEEIPTSDLEADELTVVPSKVAGLSVITRELADDSSPSAAAAVGAGLARDIARKIDAAFVGNLAAPAPAGLASLTDAPLVTPADEFAGPLDVFDAAQATAATSGATVTAWVVSPSDALYLATLKESDGSNRPLLGADPTTPTTRVIGGIPVLVATDLPAGTVYGVDSSRVFTVVRQDVEVLADRSVYFTSDRVAVRGVMRVGFGFQPGALVRVSFAVAAA